MNVKPRNGCLMSILDSGREIPKELLNLKDSLSLKYKAVNIEYCEGAYLFDAPLFWLRLGNDIDANDDLDYWQYANISNDLNLGNYNKCDRFFLPVYHLEEKTINRALVALNNFNIIDPCTVTLVIPFSIGRGLRIVSFGLFLDKMQPVLWKSTFTGTVLNG